MSESEVGSIIKTANREANKGLRSHKIDIQSFQNKLYEAAAKKLDSIVSVLRDTLAQKVAPNTVAIKEIAHETKPTDATDAAGTTGTIGTTGETRVTSVDEAYKANVEKSAEAAKESTNETSEKAEKGFSQIVNFFNGIDKMINGLADKAEGKGSNDKDNGQDLVNFVAKLNKMFSGINRAFGKNEDDNVGHRLGMAQMNKERIDQLFGGDGATNGSGKINFIGDNGDGSGNSNAVRFMSSLSSGINSALDKYKEAQDVLAQKDEKKADEESKVDGIIA
jgi:hypothetical protein